MTIAYSQPTYPAGHISERLKSLGYRFFCGVPCSYLAPLLATLAQDSEVAYLAGTREDICLGVAAGAVLADQRPAVLMQNSGLFLCSSTLLSLQVLYRMPVLLVVSWRGNCDDAPEHLVTGSRTTDLLQLLGIPYRLLSHPDAFSRSFHSCQGPIVLLVRQNELS